MAKPNFPQKIQKFEIQSYKRPKNYKDLRKTHIPFAGSPRKHPYDTERFVLVPDPFSNTFYFEFWIEDISYVEELPNLVSLEGKTITMVRIWVKKMSTGLQCLPFWVADSEDMDMEVG